VKELARLRPSLVIASGDLTQRARRAQFRAAARFLAGLPAPVLVVPGNHDIPLFDVARRFLDPVGRYRRFIGELQPLYADAELAVLGLNTARPTRWKDGRVSAAQVEAIGARLGPLPSGVFKVLVTHHPFVPAPRDPSPVDIEGAPAALAAAEGAGVELFLAGHLHEGWLSDLRQHHSSLRRSILVAQAGTAVSNRHRGEPNGYNLITIEPPDLHFEVREWDGTRFRTRAAEPYRRGVMGWRKISVS
jgi:3',5'-cyclic AMP phosphodiesterase CpdA